MAAIHNIENWVSFTAFAVTIFPTKYIIRIPGCFWNVFWVFPFHDIITIDPLHPEQWSAQNGTVLNICTTVGKVLEKDALTQRAVQGNFSAVIFKWCIVIRNVSWHYEDEFLGGEEVSCVIHCCHLKLTFSSGALRSFKLAWFRLKQPAVVAVSSPPFWKWFGNPSEWFLQF